MVNQNGLLATWYTYVTTEGYPFICEYYEWTEYSIYFLFLFLIFSKYNLLCFAIIKSEMKKFFNQKLFVFVCDNFSTRSFFNVETLNMFCIYSLGVYYANLRFNLHYNYKLTETFRKIFKAYKAIF